jgi:hypothetical protein
MVADTGRWKRPFGSSDWQVYDTVIVVLAALRRAPVATRTGDADAATRDRGTDDHIHNLLSGPMEAQTNQGARIDFSAAAHGTRNDRRGCLCR